jgi:chromosome segregation ATPase
MPPQQRRFETATLAETRRPEVSAVESRLLELRLEQDRQALERRVAEMVAQEKAELEERRAMLEERCASLEAEQKRLTRLLLEAEKQRELYRLSAAAAEDRLRDLQAEQETAPVAKGADKRFDQLRRFLARELHPDLARPDTPERAVREALFKRVWAKIEQLQ